MLNFLSGRASDRKLRLFSVACCRRIWDFITDVQCRAVVEITERSADAPIDPQEILALDFDGITDDCGGPGEPYRMAFMVAGHVGYSFIGLVHGSPYRTNDLQDAVSTSRGAAHTKALSLVPSDEEGSLPLFQQCMADEQAVQCDILRDIFGNPFRPKFAIDSSRLSWNDGIVPKLAQAIYDDRAFDRLPILADALEEAGCTNADILNHCRQPGEHVRGCWVVDLLLRAVQF
jgi:hypothetical protein